MEMAATGPSLEFRSHLLGNFLPVSLGLTRKVWSCDQFCKYLKARASITAEYQRALEKLAAKHSPPTIWFEESGVAQLWAGLVKLDEETAKAQATLSHALSERVAEKLATFRDTVDQLRRSITNDGQHHAKVLADSEAALSKTKDAYHKLSRDLEVAEWLAKHAAEDGAKEGKEGGSEKDADKKERKLARLREDTQEAETVYRAQVATTAKAQEEFYTQKMPQVLDQFELAFTQRILKVQEVLRDYAAVIDAANAQTDPFVKEYIGKVSSINPQREIEEFVEKTETVFSIPPAPVFEPFLRTPDGQPPPGAINEKSLWSRLQITLRPNADERKAKAAAASAAAAHASDGSSRGRSTSGGGIGNGLPGARATGILGASIEELMDMQKDTYPQLSVPFVANFLADGVLKLGGTSQPGVFRISGSLKSVEPAKACINAGNYVLPVDVCDCAVIFKLFLRSLPDPLLPSNVYQLAIAEGADCCAIFERIPEPAKTLAGFVVKYLQKNFLTPEVIAATQMDAPNLASIFAPCFMRSQFVDLAEVLRLVEREKHWMTEVLLKLDTSTYPSVVSDLSCSEGTPRKACPGVPARKDQSFCGAPPPLAPVGTVRVPNKPQSQAPQPTQAQVHAEQTPSPAPAYSPASPSARSAHSASPSITNLAAIPIPKKALPTPEGQGKPLPTPKP